MRSLAARTIRPEASSVVRRSAWRIARAPPAARAGPRLTPKNKSMIICTQSGEGALAGEIDACRTLMTDEGSEDELSVYNMKEPLVETAGVPYCRTVLLQ